MISLLFIIIPLLSQYQVCSASSPVLLWSNAKFPPSNVPLSNVSPLDVISKYTCKIDSEQIQVRLFAVKGLTNQDIQRGPQSNHKLLNDQSSYLYFPNVDNDAYTAFSLLPQSNNLECSKIHFQITSQKTYDTLKDALNTMETLISDIGVDSNTVVVMALMNAPDEKSLNRQRREVQVAEKSILVSDDKTCMFYADQLYWGDVEKQDPTSGNFTLNLTKSSCIPSQVVGPTGNMASAVLTLYWTNGKTETGPMILIANVTGRYWILEKVAFNGSEYRYFAYGMHNPMDTPPDYSYVCTTAVFIKYNSSSKYGIYDFKEKFYITNLQFQPFNGKGSYFGLPNYCTSFFTSGIWMGLTSGLLCLGILLFGIYRMMSIQSNDRFDDPKGKPLIIKAQE